MQAGNIIERDYINDRYHHFNHTISTEGNEIYTSEPRNSKKKKKRIN
jgi:hypothetical protein